MVSESRPLLRQCVDQDTDVPVAAEISEARTEQRMGGNPA
jgi:hypothetical protein